MATLPLQLSQLALVSAPVALWPGSHWALRGNPNSGPSYQTGGHSVRAQGWPEGRWMGQGMEIALNFAVFKTFLAPC